MATETSADVVAFKTSEHVGEALPEDIDTVKMNRGNPEVNFRHLQKVLCSSASCNVSRVMIENFIKW